MSIPDHPVDSSHIEQADVELDWTPVFEADLTGKLATEAEDEQ